MKKIIPITDLQRQTGQIINDITASSEPVLITQRGRLTAVLISAEQYLCLVENVVGFRLRWPSTATDLLVPKDIILNLLSAYQYHLAHASRLGFELRQTKQLSQPLW